MDLRRNKGKFQDKLIRKLASKYGKDPRVIKQIVYSPLRFASRVVSDPCDDRPVRIRYFGILTLKHPEGKTNMFKHRVEVMLNDITKMMILLDSMGFIITSPESVKGILKSAIKEKDYEKLQMIWDEYETIRYRQGPIGPKSSIAVDTRVQENMEQRQVR